MSGSIPLTQPDRLPLLLVKTGGSLVDSESTLRQLCDDIASMKGEYSFVIVNGGGREADRLCEAFSIPVEKVEGLRVTTPEVMDVVQMALSKSSLKLASYLSSRGLNAVPVPAFSGGLVRVGRKYVDGRDIGLVGSVEFIDSALIKLLIQGGMTPVVYPVSADGQYQLYNVNADEVASAIASSMECDALLLMTDVDGVIMNGRKQDTIRCSDVRRTIQSGCFTDGMIPKIGAASRAVESGIAQVCIMDGRKSGVISSYLREGKVNGTEIRR